nr:hypothetical protein [Tanacetum cinerariifolium]
MQLHVGERVRMICNIQVVVVKGEDVGCWLVEMEADIFGYGQIWRVAEVVGSDNAGHVSDIVYLLNMFGSEPEDMYPKSSKTVVILKFDMYIYTSTLALKELNQAIKDFCIPEGLRPRLPSPDLTMNKLLDNVIDIYVEQLDQGRMRIPFSTFLLAVIRYFQVHIFPLVSMGVNKVTMFEVRCQSLRIIATVSLSRVFYKLCKQGHWRAILDAMPWRHIDTEGCDDFSISYNEDDTDRLAEHIILLRKRPRPLPYMCGLTTDCRHPKLSQKIKDPEGKGNDSEKNGTVVSKEDPIPTSKRPPVRTTTLLPVRSMISDKNPLQKNVEKPDPKIDEAREKKEKQALVKADRDIISSPKHKNKKNF